MKLKDVTRLENPMIAEMERINNKLIEDAVICPMCEAEAETIYLDGRDVLGCENCILDDIESMDADEWLAREKEDELAEKEYWQERKYEEEKEYEILHR